MTKWLQRAAQIWCRPGLTDREMDADMASAFAEEMAKVERETLERAIQSLKEDVLAYGASAQGFLLAIQNLKRLVSIQDSEAGSPGRGVSEPDAQPVPPAQTSKAEHTCPGCGWVGPWGDVHPCPSLATQTVERVALEWMCSYYGDADHSWRKNVIAAFKAGAEWASTTPADTSPTEQERKLNYELATAKATIQRLREAYAPGVFESLRDNWGSVKYGLELILRTSHIDGDVQDKARAALDDLHSAVSCSSRPASYVWVFVAKSGMPIAVEKCDFEPSILPGKGEWKKFGEV